MAITSEDFDFDHERSRAAVAIACLQWLRCTGPAAEADPPRGIIAPEAARIRHGTPSEESPVPALEPPHPLWDRWLDG